MQTLRRYILGLLAAIMVLTSNAMVAARSVDQTGTVIVICAGGALSTVTLGPDGEPLAQAPICPDCTLQMTAHDVPATNLAPYDAQWVRVTTLRSIPNLSSVGDQRPVARGPPTVL